MKPLLLAAARAAGASLRAKLCFAIALGPLPSACAALEEQAPALDQVMARAAALGGCLKLRCDYPPVRCGPSVGSCRP